MSYAPDYDPTVGFATEETNQVAGRSTVRTVALDTELANISDSINGLNTNLKALQRDDGKFLDGILEPYALSEQARALISTGGTPRGNWAPDTIYALSDCVQNSNIAYLCITAHTSGATFQAGLWMAISGDGSSFANAQAAAASEASALNSKNVVTTKEANVIALEASAVVLEASAEASKIAAENAELAAANSATIAQNSVLSTANYFADTGTADALVVAPAWVSLQTGKAVIVKKSSAANTITAPTLNANALGAKKLFDESGNALGIGALKADLVFLAIYDAALDSGNGGFRCAGIRSNLGYTSVTAGTVFTAATSLNKIIESITNNVQAHTLPAGSTFPVGGQIVFLSKTIGNTVSRAGSDVINTGNTTFTSVPLNPGTVLRFTWDGAEWKLNITPSAGFLHNYTGGDITLNVGETAYYDLAAVTSLLLKIATGDKQEYEISFRASAVPSSSNNTYTLSINNTSYGSTISSGNIYGNISSPSVSTSLVTVGVFYLSTGSVGANYGITARVGTNTACKQVWTESRGSQASTGYITLTHGLSTDTTTVWASLGTITFTDTVSGRVTVRRIA